MKNGFLFSLVTRKISGRTGCFITVGLIFNLMIMNSPAQAISILSDEELANTAGQALLTTSFVAPSGASGGNKDFGFFKLGLEGVLELNANIKSLKLGCKPTCDIDIDNMSISGPSGGPGSSASLTNPFFEFAIKNPNSASTREFAGVRLGAAALNGLLQFGNQAAGATNTSPNGINRFSGHLVTAPAFGTAPTQSATFTNALTGKLKGNACLLFVCAPFTGTFQGSNVNFPIGPLSVNYNVPSITVEGKGLTNIPQTTISNVALPSIPLNGSLTANSDINVLGIGMHLTNPVNMSGQITNSRINIILNEQLGYIHRIPLSSNPVTLSLQKTNIAWPSGFSTAQTGWWLDVGGTVNLGNLSSASVIPINDLFGAIASQVSSYFNSNPLDVGNVPAVQTVAGGPINVSGVSIDLSSAPANNKSITNITLSAQSTVNNCWGGHSFC